MSRSLTCLTALAALGLVLASEASAFSLSRARGAVLIGRPLNVTIPATLEPGDPDAPCLEADVFHGDTRVNPRNVGLRWEAGAAGQGTIRVQSDAAVDEPVVTIYLRVGCANKITRRYVLLAEEPMDSQSVPAVAPAPAAAVPARPPAAPPATAPAAATPAPVTQQRVVTPEPLRIQPAPRLAPQRSGPRGSRGQVEPQARSQPRLKLEPLDLGPQREPSLRTSGRLEAEPTTDMERRRQAAAMWRALTAGPEEAMRNSERLQVLERDMRALFELTRKNAVALEAMREQTEKARGERNVLAMLALALAALIVFGALAWAWMRRNPGPRAAWWGGRSQEADSEFASDFVPAAKPAAPAAVETRKDRKQREKQAKDSGAAESPGPDIDLSEPSEEEASPDPGTGSAEKYRPKFSTSRWGNSDFHASYPGSSSRMLKAEELIDIQQQADFFLSIDQPDRAIALLESHLQQQSETSALAWVDLLDIYHQLGSREDYDRIRAGFHERFNAQVPAFEEFTHEQDGLEKYGRALSRIVSLWPSRRVLDVIEESLLRRPDDKDTEAFDLEAYRELVLLYNIGKEVAQDDEEATPAKAAPAHFGDTSMLRLSELQAATRPHASDELHSDMTEPAPLSADSVEDVELTSENMGLDIDLGIFSESPEPTPEPTPAPLMDLDSLDWRSIR